MEAKPQHQQQGVVKKRVTFVHNPYNSPLGLYSTAEVADTLQRYTQLLTIGAEFGVAGASASSPNLVPAQPALTQVRCTMLTEEQQQRDRRPWQLQNEQAMTSSEAKRVAWPPVNSSRRSMERNETTNDNNDYMTGSLPGQQVQSTTHKVAPRVPPKPAKPANWNNRDLHQQQQADQTSGRIARHENSGTSSPKSATRFQQNNGGVEEDIMPNEVREPFASNELVGERKLIEKPEPPSGLILGRRLKAEAPVSQEPQPVYSTESYFKRPGTAPVRMLGDMVWPPKGSASVTDKSRETSQSPGPVRRQAKDYRGFFGQHQLPPNFPTYRAPPGTQFFGLEGGENPTAM